jgi:uncharacterized membrane protein
MPQRTLSLYLNGEKLGKSPILFAYAFVWENGVMQDLGTLCGDLCLHGNNSGAMGINNDGVIVGYSNHAILHKGKKLFSSPKAVIWENGKIKRLDITDDKIYVSSIVRDINNRNQIIYWPEGTGQCCLRDMLSGNETVLSGGYNCKRILENGTYLRSDWAMINCINTDSKNYRFIPSPDIRNSIWKQINCHTDVNNSNWVVGDATTIYGEPHAVLLRPKS